MEQTGKGANPAKVTIYGVNGADNIESYNGMITPKSDNYSTLNEEDYRASYYDMATSVYEEAETKKHVPPIQSTLTYLIQSLDGKSPFKGTKNGKTITMNGVFFHRTNWSEKVTNAPEGCPIIDDHDWEKVEKQLEAIRKAG